MLSEPYESCKFWVLWVQSNFVSLILSPVQFCKKTQVTYEASQHNTPTTARNPIIHIIVPLGKHGRSLGAIIEDLDDKYISPPGGDGHQENPRACPALKWAAQSPGPSSNSAPSLWSPLMLAPHLWSPPLDQVKEKERSNPSEKREFEPIWKRRSLCIWVGKGLVGILLYALTWSPSL